MNEGFVDWLMKDIPYFNRLCQKGGEILVNAASTSMTKQQGCWNKEETQRSVST